MSASFGVDYFEVELREELVPTDSSVGGSCEIAQVFFVPAFETKVVYFNADVDAEGDEPTSELSSSLHDGMRFFISNVPTNLVFAGLTMKLL